VEIFRELVLRGTQQDLAEFISYVERSLKHGWQRNHEPEKRAAAGGSLQYCFQCPATEQLPESWLFIMFKDNSNCAYVSNVVPSAIGKISLSQYNMIITEFHTRFIAPALATFRGRIECTVSAGEEDLRDWMSAKAASLLQEFSSIANRSTGSSHPLDRQRWLAFLVTIHQEKSTLTSSQLKRWFVEEAHWHSDIAGDLIMQFEFAMDVLKAHDEVVP